METSDQIAATVLNVPESTFFAEDATAFHNLEWKLVTTNFRGIALSSPEKVNLAKNPKLPILVASRIGALRDWETPLAENLALISYDHFSHEFLVTSLLEKSPAGKIEKEKAPRGPKPEGDDATGVGTQISCMDAASLLSLSSEPRQVSFRIVSFDYLSNVASTKIEGGEKKPRLDLGDPTPHDASLPNPALPIVRDPSKTTSKTWGTIKVEKGHSGWRVFGRFETPAQSAYLLPSPRSAGPVPLVAIIPATLVVVGKDWHQPWLFPISLAAIGKAIPSEGQPLNGEFSYSIPLEKSALLKTGPTAVHLLIGGQSSTILEVVD